MDYHNSKSLLLLLDILAFNLYPHILGLFFPTNLHWILFLQIQYAYYLESNFLSML